jgi:hypothetical protein
MILKQHQQTILELFKKLFGFPYITLMILISSDRVLGIPSGK